MTLVPAVVFRFFGGFAIGQYICPVLMDNFTSSTGSGSSLPPVLNVPEVSGMIGKLNFKLKLTPREMQRSLGEDIEAALRHYKWCAAVLTALIVGAGGLPAFLGCGTSVYFSGADGKKRYIKVKQWLKDSNLTL